MAGVETFGVDIYTSTVSSYLYICSGRLRLTQLGRGGSRGWGGRRFCVVLNPTFARDSAPLPPTHTHHSAMVAFTCYVTRTPLERRGDEGGCLKVTLSVGLERPLQFDGVSQLIKMNPNFGPSSSIFCSSACPPFRPYTCALIKHKTRPSAPFHSGISLLRSCARVGQGGTKCMACGC